VKLSLWSLGLLIWIWQAVAPQMTTVNVQLRAADGSPIVGTSLQLVAFSAELAQAQPCLTNRAGSCIWPVEAGLYELLSDQPLDALSRYAVAESGLRGLGITVGDAPITYTLTIQPDNFLYFDTAPDALTPVPFIPTEANTHLTFTPTATAEVSAVGEPSQTTENTLTDTTTTNPSAAETVSEDSSLSNRLLIIIGIGSGIGIGLALLPRLRRRLQGGRHA
jgi:hypothetical protein